MNLLAQALDRQLETVSWRQQAGGQVGNLFDGAKAVAVLTTSSKKSITVRFTVK